MVLVIFVSLEVVSETTILVSLVSKELGLDTMIHTNILPANVVPICFLFNGTKFLWHHKCKNDKMDHPLLMIASLQVSFKNHDSLIIVSWNWVREQCIIISDNAVLLHLSKSNNVMFDETVDCNFEIVITVTIVSSFQGYSCIDLLNAGMRDSGVYYLQIRGTTYWFLKVFCEQEIADGGWTVSLFCKLLLKFLF